MQQLLSKNDLAIIEQIYNENDFINAVYLCGSVIYPWIKNPHDIDIIFVVNNNIIPDWYKLIKDIRFETNNISCLWRQEDQFTNIEKSIPCLSYTIPLYKHLFGKKYISNIDFLTDKNIKESILRQLNGLYLQSINKKKFNKSAYHIITSLFILENNSYNLTDKQINDINYIHDNINCELSKYWIDYYYKKYGGLLWQN